MQQFGVEYDKELSEKSDVNQKLHLKNLKNKYSVPESNILSQTGELKFDFSSSV